MGHAINTDYVSRMSWVRVS